jgi:outer membrane protein
MKTIRNILAAALAALFASAALHADDGGPWQFRLRSTYLDMSDRSDAFSALGINFPSNAVTVNSKWIPEFDVSYSFTSHLAAELVLTVPQTQDVSLAGVGPLGTFKHLPPVLALQYHLLPGSLIDPYVGLGVNYTLIYGANLAVAGIPLALDTHSFGVAGQAGADIRLGHGFFLNVDAKKVQLGSDVYVYGGPRLTTAHLDPWLLSFGAGYRF